MKSFIQIVLCVLGVMALRPASAGLSNCTDIYVGTIAYYYNANPVVVFLASPGDNGGSYAISLADFTADQQKTIIAMLLAAKMNGHRVSISTAASGQCGITTTWQNLRMVAVNDNP